MVGRSQGNPKCTPRSVSAPNAAHRARPIGFCSGTDRSASVRNMPKREFGEALLLGLLAEVSALYYGRVLTATAARAQPEEKKFALNC